MSTGLAFGTLFAWCGWAMLVACGVMLLGIATRAPGIAMNRSIARVAVTGFASALLLILAFKLTSPISGGKTLNMPLLWPSMPFWSWLAIAAFVMFAVKSIQSATEFEPHLRRHNLITGMIWAAVCACAALMSMRSSEPIHLIKGTMPLSWTTSVAVTLLLIVAIASMSLAGKNATVRKYGTGAVKHFVLLVGSMVFGLPFLWLAITSFKEDRDMVSPEGLVWIPKVQETIKSFDEENPLFEGRLEGMTVRGSIVSENTDKSVNLNIEEPLSLGGRTLIAQRSELKLVPRDSPVVSGTYKETVFTGRVAKELENGKRLVKFLSPPSLVGSMAQFAPGDLDPVRNIGLRTKNYTEALQYLPPETNSGLVYLKNTLILVILNVVGTILSSSIVAYAFSRLRFPGKRFLFAVLLSTMMLPAAVTLLPTFLIFRTMGWIDTLTPLWITAFFASAFNVFMLRQFFMNVPMELEDAAKIDGCSYLRTFWSVMLPQVMPALAVIAIWTFMAAWNNFMGPLIYINSPENMPIAYAVQLFASDRYGEPGLLMAFATMAILPVLVVFFALQKYFIEGVSLSGLGGR